MPRRRRASGRPATRTPSTTRPSVSRARRRPPRRRAHDHLPLRPPCGPPRPAPAGRPMRTGGGRPAHPARPIAASSTPSPPRVPSPDPNEAAAPTASGGGAHGGGAVGIPSADGRRPPLPDGPARDRRPPDPLHDRPGQPPVGRPWQPSSPPDATLDYRSAGGIRGSFPEVERLVGRRSFPSSPGPSTLFSIERSTSLQEPTPPPRATAFSNPNGAVVDGRPWLFVVGGAYHDRLLRTPAGWRISHRVEETLWWDNPMPGLPPSPPPVPDDAFT